MGRPEALRAAGAGGLLGLAWAAAQVFGSRVAGQAAGVLAGVLVARALGPEAFGLYSVAWIAALLLSTVPGTGLDMAAVSESGRHWAGDAARGRGVILAALLLRLGCALLLAGGAALLTLPQLGLVAPELALPLRFAAAATLALTVGESMLAALQSQERFGAILAVSLLIAGLRLGPVLALLALGRLTLATALSAFLAAALLGALAAAILARPVWARPRVWGAGQLRQLLARGGWLMVATSLGAVTGSLDVLVLAQRAGPEAAGVFSAARNLALPIMVGAAAVGAVLLPRLSRLPPGAMAGETGALTVRICALALLAALALGLAAAPLTALVYGDTYRGAAAVFAILALAYLSQGVAWPSLAALVVLRRSRTVALLSLLMLALTAAGYLALAGAGGAPAVALVYLAGCVLTGGIYLICARRVLRAAASQGAPTADGGPLQAERQGP